MLINIGRLYGRKLGALDGEIGQVEDFYFDDRNWVVRYVVADTASWLTGLQVLLSPHAFGILHPAENALSVHLTRQQIENSPSIELHKPVSRQYEEEHYQYYGWPSYWEGNELWGMSGIPVVLPIMPPADEPAATHGLQSNRADAHLRCAEAVKGYHIKTIDGTIGHVNDFMMDAQSWAIQKLVIKIGHLFSGREVEIPTNRVDRISFEESTVFVNMTNKDVEQSPDHLLVGDSAAD